MRVVPFAAWHIYAMDLQPAQADALSVMSIEDARGLEGPHAFTMLDNEHQPIASAGVLHVWGSRGLAWSFLSCKATGPAFVAVTRAVRSYLARTTYQRIEAAVNAGHEAGERWLRLLGFRPEMDGAVLRKYQPDGQDATLWSMVR